MRIGLEQILDNKELFTNKRIGLITNHTGITRNFETNIEIFQKHFNLVALYAPEHGVRGDVQAGKKVETYIDDQSKLPVYSLYGQNRRPSKEILDGVDMLVYDIQDVGARFYTYIYTMSHCMEAAKEHNLEFVVLDRPNPVNATDVEGTILDIENFRSFIGYYPIVQRYGLTCGEVALLFNKEYEINCNLNVVKLDGYDRTKDYEELDYTYIMASPNLPTINSCYLYLSTCIFEGTNVSEGRGTTKPFEIIGAPYLNAKLIIKELDKLNFEGIKYKQTYFTPVTSKHENVLCNGIEFFLTDKKKFKPVEFAFNLLYLIKLHHKKEFEIVSYGPRPMLGLNVGRDYFLKDEINIEGVINQLRKDTEEFKKIRKNYLLY